MDYSGIINDLRTANRISPAQQQDLLALNKMGKLTDDDLVKVVETTPTVQEANPVVNFARGAARSIPELAGLPGTIGDVAQQIAPNMKLGAGNNAATEAVRGLATLGALPSSEQLVSGAENLTGMRLDSGGGFADRLGSFVGGGLLGGAPGIARKGAAEGGAAALRSIGGNISGSGLAAAGSQAGAQYGPGGELAGALGATGAGMAAGGALKMLLRGGLMPWKGKREMMVESYARQKEAFKDPNVATAAHGGAGPGLVAALESVPLANKPIRESAVKINLEAQKRLRDITGAADTVAESTMEELAGRAVHSAINRRTAYIRNESAKNYAQVDNLLGDKTQAVDIAEMATYLRKMARTELPEAERAMVSSVSPPGVGPAQQAQQMLDSIFASGQPVNYRALDAMRKAAGENIDGNLLAGNSLGGFYRGLYSAISKDLERAAKKMGGEDAARQVRKARLYWQAERAITDKALQGIASKAPELELVYRGVINDTLSSPTKIRAVLKFATPEEKDLIARAFIAKLGKVGDRDEIVPNWSIDSFVRNWDKSSSLGKTMLLGHNPRMRRDMDNFVKSMREVAVQRGTLANPSGTAGRGLNAAVLYSALGIVAGLGVNATTGSEQAAGAAALAPLILGGGVGNVAARLLMSPRFTSWLATSAAGQPSSLPKHIGRLSGIIASTDDAVLVNDIQTFIEAMNVMSEDSAKTMEMDNPRKLRYGNE